MWGQCRLVDEGSRDGKVEGSDIVGRYVKAPAKRETTLTDDHIETSVC